MGQLVVQGAMMQCSFGIAPAALNVIPTARVVAGGGMPAACILDSKPLINIQPFGMCTSLSNPTVASATAAALGVLTPMPCVPVTPAPWIPGGAPTVLVGTAPALDNLAKCMCMWGGLIQFVFPGQMTVQTP
jgi:hypothetical protein